MSNQTVSKLWWVNVLERAGRIPSQPPSGSSSFIMDNPVYARSLARAYLAESKPRQSNENTLVPESQQAA